MFYPTKMEKVRIIGVKRVVSDVVAKLHELGVVEISVADYKAVEPGRPLDNYTELSNHLIFVRAIKGMLSSQRSEDKTISLEDFKKQFELLPEFVSKLNGFSKNQFDSLKSGLTKYIESVNEL